MPHLIVVGAGIVGLCCAWSAQRRGWQVTLVDRDVEGDRASHGNAGGIAVSECAPLNLSGLGLQPLRWLLDPLGPLAIRPAHAPRLLPWFLALRRVAHPANYLRIARALAALNDRSLQDFERLLADIGMGRDLHKRGALTVYETQDAFRADAREWELKRSLGVRWRPVDAGELRTLEPALAPVFAQAVMLEDWAHIDDPLRIVTGVRHHVQSLGGRLVTGEVSSLLVDLPAQPAVLLADGRRLAADRVLVAAGAWSARLAGSIGDRPLLESERGYNTTLPSSIGMLQREVIFAERKFVATPLSVGLRIGGAAEFAGLDAPANYRRSDALLQLARRYLPQLDVHGSRPWMGNRPATPDSLPVIGVSPAHPSVLYAFGHGHLGLTQSATTGELVGELLDSVRPSVDLTPYRVDRF
jgi:D-amino-acid dehydrogenase